jgi:hypothetical protein
MAIFSSKSGTVIPYTGNPLDRESREAAAAQDLAERIRASLAQGRQYRDEDVVTLKNLLVSGDVRVFFGKDMQRVTEVDDDGKISCPHCGEPIPISPALLVAKLWQIHKNPYDYARRLITAGETIRQDQVRCVRCGNLADFTVQALLKGGESLP